MPKKPSAVADKPKKKKGGDDAAKGGESKPVVKKAPIRAVRRAQKVQKKVVKGTHGTRVKKVRTTVQFRRPKTFRPPRDAKYPRKAIPRRNRYVVPLQ